MARAPGGYLAQSGEIANTFGLEDAERAYDVGKTLELGESINDPSGCKTCVSFSFILNAPYHAPNRGREPSTRQD